MKFTQHVQLPSNSKTSAKLSHHATKFSCFHGNPHGMIRRRRKKEKKKINEGKRSPNFQENKLHGSIESILQKKCFRTHNEENWAKDDTCKEPGEGRRMEKGGWVGFVYRAMIATEPLEEDDFTVIHRKV